MGTLHPWLSPEHIYEIGILEIVHSFQPFPHIQKEITLSIEFISYMHPILYYLDLISPVMAGIFFILHFQLIIPIKEALLQNAPTKKNKKKSHQNH